MNKPHFKARPEDFIVDEVPLYPATGEGPHTFIRIEKRSRTTEEVAAELARVSGTQRREVGYAGIKDRVAVTRQWFSLADIEPERAMEFQLTGAKVLEAVRHQHKLRTGHLRGNRFEIWVRDLNATQIAEAQARVATIDELGFANKFGSQRFGRDGDNPQRGLEILNGEKRLKDRRHARFLVSALQSAVFNEVLAARELPLDQFEIGDLAMKHDSGGVFPVEDVETENLRAKSFEISPSGPIFGKKVARPLGVPAEREAEVLAKYGIDAEMSLTPPRGISLRGARRAFRARPEGLEHSTTNNAFRLAFTLMSGSYATVLLEELFGELSIGSGENLA